MIQSRFCGTKIHLKSQSPSNVNGVEIHLGHWEGTALIIRCQGHQGMVPLLARVCRTGQTVATVVPFEMHTPKSCTEAYPFGGVL